MGILMKFDEMQTRLRCRGQFQRQRRGWPKFWRN